MEREGTVEVFHGKMNTKNAGNIPAFFVWNAPGMNALFICWNYQV